MSDYTTLLMNAIKVIILFLMMKVIRWFLDPYFVYNRRKMDKDIEMYINGKKFTKSQLGLPFLLRRKVLTTQSDEICITQSDLCGLGLVVPCYNEEQRLPVMLSEHIAYIKKLQKENRLPDRVEIILVDDGSKDGTLKYIKEMTEKYPEEQAT
jgi:cellulose synthase/poly-beta-1,6-N-acetylglucosamine synthase-like glycosyltransferase